MSAITSETRPTALAPIFENVPADLTVWPHFVTWRFTKTDKGKWTKPPFMPTGERASSTAPETWRPFEDVVEAYGRGGWDGIGTALVPGRSGVDLDDVRDPETGEIHPEALRIVQEINSYTEVSPSDRGLRIFTVGAVPDGWRNARRWVVPIEMYDGRGGADGQAGGRYLTITGHHLPGTPLTVEDRTAELAALHARVKDDLARTEVIGTNGHHPAPTVDDAALLTRARNGKHGDRFRRLYDAGDWQGAGYPSPSEADLALCSALAFWANRDGGRVDRLYRASALMRDKWDERHGAQTYGALTIARAVESCSEGYTGARARREAEAHPVADLDPEVLRDLEPAGQEAESHAPFVVVTPPAGFITKYVTVAQQRTDAPGAAHELAAVLVLSALAGPRVRLPLAYRSDGVRLVLWGMNVVDSTSGRKTTVNEFACDVLRQVLGDGAILPWKGSPEAFVQAFAARDGQAAVFARDEYTGLLAQIKKGGYVAGLVQDFIRAYDGLPIVMARTAKMNRKTGQRVDDTDRVRDPYLVQLCAATRTSFITTAGIEDVLDGLLARFIFTSGTAEEQQARRMTPALEEAWREVVALARGFHERADELLRVEIPDAIFARHWEIEKRYKADAQAAPRPDAAGPALKRLAETVLKVAALLAIDRTTTGSAMVEADDLAAAEVLAGRWKGTTLALIADLGRSRFQALCDDVLATIRKHPKGISRYNLFRAHRGLKGREFDEVLDALLEQRLIHVVVMRTGKAGAPPTVYRPGPPEEEA